MRMYNKRVAVIANGGPTTQKKLAVVWIYYCQRWKLQKIKRQ